MNKTFNDPNTKYSDQGTPVSQAKSIADSIASVEDAVDGLGETIEELSEKVDLIPTPVVADDGKVLTATDDGAYELADVDALPAISAGDAGKVLTVNAGETGAEWATPSGGGGHWSELKQLVFSFTATEMLNLAKGGAIAAKKSQSIAVSTLPNLDIITHGGKQTASALTDGDASHMYLQPIFGIYQSSATNQRVDCALIRLSNQEPNATAASAVNVAFEYKYWIKE